MIVSSPVPSAKLQRAQGALYTMVPRYRLVRKSGRPEERRFVPLLRWAGPERGSLPAIPVGRSCPYSTWRGPRPSSQYRRRA